MQIKLDANGVVIPDSDKKIVPDRVIDISIETNEVVQARAEREEKKNAIRSVINQVAEQSTREGVISDVSAVLVVGLAQTIKAISAGKDLAEVKASIAGLQPFADAVLTQLATPADMKNPAAAIEAGKVVMPYLVKGDAAKVVKDMGRLANGVSAALLAAKPA